MGDIAQITLNGGGVPAIHVLKTNGDLYCWGRNSEGQLGVGNTALTSSPTLVTTGVAEIMSKSFVQHTYEFRIQVFIRKGTDIYCTGYNNVYQLGLGYTTAVNTFTLNPLLSNPDNRVKFIGRTTSSADKATMVAVLENNDIMAWGNGGNQSIFNGETVHVRYPLKISWEV